MAAARRFQEGRNRSDGADRKRAELATVDKQVARVAAELDELRQGVADTAKAATADLAAIRTRLPA